MEIKLHFVPPGFASLILCLLNTSPIQAKDAFLSGVLLLKNGQSIQTDYTELNDSYFVRSERIGRYIQKSDTLDIVSDDYFKKIQNSSPWKSSLQSAIYLNSSASYQWTTDQNAVFKEDLTDRIIKVSLIVLTGYFFFEAQKSNEALQNTFTGINSSGAKDKFQRDYTNYQIAGALTILTFSLSALKAYVRFGRNPNWDSLGIEQRKLVTLEEYSNDPKNLNHRYPNNSVEILFTKSF
ncbi:MAG: hypothetical protein O9301_10290 [Leptospira sp.]|nr:hypothetical protein [Leptospira sp.]